MTHMIKIHFYSFTKLEKLIINQKNICILLNYIILDINQISYSIQIFFLAKKK